MEDKKFEIEVLEERCKACSLCITNCPRKLFKPSKEINSKGYNPAVWLGIPFYFTKEEIENFSKKNPKFVKNSLLCAGCKACYDVCPEAAIKIYTKNEKNLGEK